MRRGVVVLPLDPDARRRSADRAGHGPREPEAHGDGRVVRVHRRRRATSRPATTRSRRACSRRRTGTALAHAGYEDLLFNGIPASAITMEDGATRLGIEQFGPIVTRGILCDVARLKGVEWFDEPYAITGDDLDACVSAAGLAVEPGDVILVRTEPDALAAGGQQGAVRRHLARRRRRRARVAARQRRRRDRHRHAHVRAVPRRGREPVPLPGAHDRAAGHGHPAGPAVGCSTPLAADCAADGVYECPARRPRRCRSSAGSADSSPRRPPSDPHDRGHRLGVRPGRGGADPARSGRRARHRGRPARRGRGRGPVVGRRARRGGRRGARSVRWCARRSGAVRRASGRRCRTTRSSRR